VQAGLARLLRRAAEGDSIPFCAAVKAALIDQFLFIVAPSSLSDFAQLR
jgi:hypothetical protein